MAARLPADEHRPHRLEYRRLVRLGVTPTLALVLADPAGRQRKARRNRLGEARRRMARPA
jgi:hypothetical protein